MDEIKQVRAAPPCAASALWPVFCVVCVALAPPLPCLQCCRSSERCKVGLRFLCSNSRMFKLPCLPPPPTPPPAPQKQRDDYNRFSVLSDTLQYEPDNA